MHLRQRLSRLDDRLRFLASSWREAMKQKRKTKNRTEGMRNAIDTTQQLVDVHE
jgi:hypothetical protein